MRTRTGTACLATACLATVVATLMSCTHQTRIDVAHAVVSCLKQEGTVLQAIDAEFDKLAKIAKSSDADRWTKVLMTAVGDGLVVGGCAFARLVYEKHEINVAARSSIESPQAVFEDYRLKYAGGAIFELKENQ